MCTFTPAVAGQFAVRIKSSAIVLPDGTPVADTGSGYNGFALRVAGGTATRLYAFGVLSVWTNTPSSDARFYLAEVTTADAGKRMQIDLFDPGDGNGGQYTCRSWPRRRGRRAWCRRPGRSSPPGAGGLVSVQPEPIGHTRPRMSQAPYGADAANCQVITRFRVDPGASTTTAG